MTKKMKTYSLLVAGERVPVTEEVYRAYYQERERERYLDKQARSKELSIQALQDMGFPVDHHAGALPSSEESYIKEIESQALQEALSSLSPEKQEGLWSLVNGEKTERELAKEIGVSPATIHRRKKSTLKALKNALSKQV